MYTEPLPPNVDGAFSIIRIALILLPNALEISWLVVWIAAECPKPLNSTVWAAFSIRSSVEFALIIPNTGESFSLVIGSLGPISLTSQTKIWTSSATLKPACSAIQVAFLPGTMLFNLASFTFSLYAVAPNMNCSSFFFSSALQKCTW